MPVSTKYRESTPIPGFDDFELLVDDGLHADGFLVQMLEFAKALHPLRLLGAGASAVRQQLVAQCLRNEFLERLTARGRSSFGFTEEPIRKFEYYLHRYPVLDARSPDEIIGCDEFRCSYGKHGGSQRGEPDRR